MGAFLANSYCVWTIVSLTPLSNLYNAPKAPCSPAIARAPWGELEGDLPSAGFGQEGSEMSPFFC